MIAFPFPNGIEPGLDRELVLRRVIQPRRQAHPGPLSGVCRRDRNIVVECHRKLSYCYPHTVAPASYQTSGTVGSSP